MSTENQPIIKYIFEIRVAPYPNFLDKRGEVASKIVATKIFDTWRIDTNRIQFTKKDNPNIAGSVSFTGFGIAYESPISEEEFVKTCKEFMDVATQNLPMSIYNRVGLRTNILIPKDSSLEELNNKIKSNFIKLNETDIEKFGGDLVDIAIPLNFVEKDSSNKFNLNYGVMKKEQSKQFFVDEDVLPEIGIFLDIDYFRDTDLFIKSKEYKDFIEKGISRAKVAKDTLLELTEGKA